MKTDEVPQDHLSYYGEARRAVYAVDDTGHYTTVGSSGWTAEAQVNADAVAEFDRMAAAARERARSERASPLEYHMYTHRMDLPLLAQATGFWKCTIRRHFRAERFARLSLKRLQRYAEAFGMDVDSLRRLP